MRFTALPVHSFEDATLDLEQLQALLTTPGANTLPFLQLLAAADVQVAFGAVSFVFSASVVSAAVNVSHGIGRAPRVWVQSRNTLIAAAVTASTVSTFTANGFVTNNTATSATVTMDWVAIG